MKEDQHPETKYIYVYFLSKCIPHSIMVGKEKKIVIYGKERNPVDLQALRILESCTCQHQTFGLHPMLNKLIL